MPKLDSPGEFNSIKLAKGVYAALVTIKEIEDLSNYPWVKGELNKRSDGTPFELCIKVKYTREDGEEWSSMFWGDFKKDEVTGKLKGWKAFGNGVQEFFMTMYGSKEEVGNRLNDDWSISPALLEPLRGRRFYRISYISGLKENGKGRYKDFNRIFLEGATIEQMQDVWASVAPKMTTYKPDVVDELERMKDNKDTQFNYGANVPNESDDPPFEADSQDFDL